MEAILNQNSRKNKHPEIYLEICLRIDRTSGNRSVTVYDPRTVLDVQRSAKTAKRMDNGIGFPFHMLFLAVKDAIGDTFPQSTGREDP